MYWDGWAEISPVMKCIAAGEFIHLEEKKITSLKANFNYFQTFNPGKLGHSIIGML